MRALASGALLVVAAFVLASPARAETPHHVALWYLSEPGDLATEADWVVAYRRPDGEALDWLCDGLILTTIELQNGHDPGPSPATFARYRQRLFDEGGLAGLDATVRRLRDALGDPGYRLQIYLETGYHGGADASAEVRDLHDRFVAGDYAALELAGFYWGHQEEVWGSYGSVMRATSDFIHRLDPTLEMTWIPYLHSSGSTSWSRWGVDRVSQQVGYAFADASTTRFADADDARLSSGMHGVELEIAADVRNARVPGESPFERQLESALTYMRAAHHFNWGKAEFATYYHANAIIVYGRTNSALRRVYDALYELVSQNPRSSVARRITIPVSADTFTEHDPDYLSANHGGSESLLVGTNLYGSTGNPARAHLAFDDARLTTPGEVLAAHLEVDVDYFPYGRDLDDVSLYVDDEPAWTEAGLTGASEPPVAESSELRRLRLHADGSRAYAWGITETLRAMRATDDHAVGFVLRRRREDRAERMVALWSKEGAGPGPRITLVLAPGEPGPCAAGEGSCDAGGTADGGTTGADAGILADATPGDDENPDAGDGGIPESPGCGCRVAPAGGPTSHGAWLFGPLLWLVARRSTRLRRRPG